VEGKQFVAQRLSHSDYSSTMCPWQPDHPQHCDNFMHTSRKLLCKTVVNTVYEFVSLL